MRTSKTNIATPRHQIELELLALDLVSCTRCVGTLDNIETAIDKVKRVLNGTGIKINVNKILIESEEEGEKEVGEISECCSAEKQDTCCEPSEKEACCQTTESEKCGCQ